MCRQRKERNRISNRIGNRIRDNLNFFFDKPKCLKIYQIILMSLSFKAEKKKVKKKQIKKREDDLQLEKKTEHCDTRINSRHMLKI